MQNACVKCYKRVHSPGNKFFGLLEARQASTSKKAKLIKVGQEQK